MDFNWNEFKNFYFASSSYADQQKLAEAFYKEWNEIYQTRWHYAHINHMDYEAVKEKFNTKSKKDLKVRLQGKGFSAQGIDGLFRSLTKWLSAH